MDKDLQAAEKALAAYAVKAAWQADYDTTQIKSVCAYVAWFLHGVQCGFQGQGIADLGIHQPKSTLLLLISAFVGDDWKRIYEYAMKNDFRFLSYGDSSLLKNNINN